MNPKKDITNLKFNRLTAIRPVGKAKDGKHELWLTKCDCGNEKEVIISNLINSTTKSCGCLKSEILSIRMKGKNHYNWKEGKAIIDGKGYKVFKHGELRGVKEHRYVYEQHYGITLTRSQNIHHINGDKLDNRIENLELWDKTQPCGQRVEDKINFYFSLVEQYKEHPLYKDLISEKFSKNSFSGIGN